MSIHITKRVIQTPWFIQVMLLLSIKFLPPPFGRIQSVFTPLRKFLFCLPFFLLRGPFSQSSHRRSHPSPRYIYSSSKLAFTRKLKTESRRDERRTGGLSPLTLWNARCEQDIWLQSRNHSLAGCLWLQSGDKLCGAWNGKQAQKSPTF